MKLPYQIQRAKLANGMAYQFDLVNTATGKLIASAFTKSPIAPRRLAERQAQLNSKHFFAEVRP